jgi:hypothetical protein
MSQQVVRTLLGRFFLGAALLLSAALSVSAAQTKPPAKKPASTRKRVAISRKTTSKKIRKPVVHAQAAPTPDRIKEIQTALQREGAYSGQPTGKWDTATSEALRKYQTDNGFAPTGKIDALSLNKLGLGSDTAGKGAPVPTALTTAPPAKP